jgi:hypothetical protein
MIQFKIVFACHFLLEALDDNSDTPDLLLRDLAKKIEDRIVKTHGSTIHTLYSRDEAIMMELMDSLDNLSDTLAKVTVAQMATIGKVLEMHSDMSRVELVSEIRHLIDSDKDPKIIVDALRRLFVV